MKHCVVGIKIINKNSCRLTLCQINFLTQIIHFKLDTFINQKIMHLNINNRIGQDAL